MLYRRTFRSGREEHKREDVPTLMELSRKSFLRTVYNQTKGTDTEEELKSKIENIMGWAASVSVPDTSTQDVLEEIRFFQERDRIAEQYPAFKEYVRQDTQNWPGTAQERHSKLAELEEMFGYVSKQIPKMGSLKTLELYDQKIGDAGMQALSAVIGNGAFPDLEELELSGNQIGYAGVSALANACASGALGKLVFLRLDRNQISDAGMTVLADAIRSGSMANLERLELVRNQISDAGMTALADAIPHMASLKNLSLGDNQIGDSGMTAFAGAIGASGAMGSLEYLFLNNNNIGDVGMIAFSAAIRSGALRALDNLYLYPNPGDGGPAMRAFRRRC